MYIFDISKHVVLQLELIMIPSLVTRYVMNALPTTVSSAFSYVIFMFYLILCFKIPCSCVLLFTMLLFVICLILLKHHLHQMIPYFIISNSSYPYNQNKNVCTSRVSMIVSRIGRAEHDATSINIYLTGYCTNNVHSKVWKYFKKRKVLQYDHDTKVS